jgi:superfamily II DNA/RNA helicase
VKEATLQSMLTLLNSPEIVKNMKSDENTSSPESFSGLPLKEPLLNNLVLLDYHTMTAIQQQSLPIMLT